MANKLSAPVAVLSACIFLCRGGTAQIFKIPFTTDLAGVFQKGSYGPDGPWQAVAIIPRTEQEPDAFGQAEFGFPLVPVWPSDFPATQLLLSPQPGGLYNISNTSTLPWQTFANKDANPMDQLELYQQKKSTGLGVVDGLTIFTTSNTLPITARANATIYAVNTSEIVLRDGRTYSPEVGIFGLGRPGDLGLPGQSVLAQMKSAGAITSSSFGLHIGSVPLEQPGSLILGGYDGSRVIGSVGVFEMRTGMPLIYLLDIFIGVEGGSWPASDSSREHLGSIWPGTPEKTAEIMRTQFGGREGSVLIHANPAVPGIYLPSPTCANAAKHLPVTFDDKSGYYLWNTTSPDYMYFLENSGAYLAFVLADSRAENITIKVPFKLLNLTLESPIMDKPTPYFPCQDTTINDELYMWDLGRAFLQSAFFGVNYEQNVTFLAQAPGPGVGQALIDKLPVSDRTVKSQPAESFAASWQSQWKINKASTVSTDSQSSHPAGAVAGIVIGALVGVGLAAAALWLIFWRGKKQRQTEPAELSPETAEVHDNGSASTGDIEDIKDLNEADVPNHGYGVHEMAGTGHEVSELAESRHQISELASPERNYAEAPGSPGVYEMPADPYIPPPGWSPAREVSPLSEMSK
ncbi:aspartic peptidase domain-containing protein [Podospora australis]|uniref:Aspartic peptidase domain-containing protein n=1 Tax=Podospora australis TaxID=1536484 RepID=A0AAN6WKZ6_9PEZI|nr:aspartic peptidase domain-containing protein [Podospora australis]